MVMLMTVYVLLPGKWVILDRVSFDWSLPGGPGGDNMPPSIIDGYFEGWIQNRKDGTDNQRGHIVLENSIIYAYRN